MKFIFGLLLLPSGALLAWWPKAVLSLIFLFDNDTGSTWAALVRGIFVLAVVFYPLAWFISLFGFFAFALSKTKYSLRTSGFLSAFPYLWILCALGVMQVAGILKPPLAIAHMSESSAFYPNQPNQSLEPMARSVTPRACARVAPALAMAHHQTLGHWHLPYRAAVNVEPVL